MQIEIRFKNNNLLEFSMNFTVQPEDLIKIVGACQQRSYDEEIQLLKQKGDTLDWLFQALNTHQSKGIASDETSIAERRKKFGTNQKAIKQLAGFFELFCQALEDFTMRILLAAAILSIVLQTSTATPSHRSTAWIEGFAVLMAVFVCATVTAVNDYQKERQFQSLNSVADEKKRLTVKRDGLMMEIHQDFLLVGDIVTVNQGIQLPADGILFQSNEITTDQSAMTGETEPVKKNTLRDCINKKEYVQKNGQKNIADKHEVPSPILMSGTKVLTGQGKMIVLVVGQHSCIGKIRNLLEQDQPQPTPLQAKLEKLAEDIGKFGLYSAILILVILLIRFAIVKGLSRDWDTGKDLNTLLNYLILGITVVVVAIPEGLPLSVTLSLAFSVKKMLKDQNLVRKMQACETMGGANNICSDKTGTLTMNKMTLTQIWNYQTKMVDTYSETTPESDLSKNKQFVQLFKIATLVNSSAVTEPEEKGSSTEIALLKYFKRMGVNYQDCRNKYQIKAKFPFSSSRKRMSVVINYNETAHLFIKGASQIVLASCSEWFNNQSGQIEHISPETSKKINQVIIKMAENSLRTLCLGYKKMTVHDDLEAKDERGVFQCQKQNIVLLAIIGVKDIPRKEVPQAIKKCHRAGITVRMVTGDNIITAKAIAKQIGLTKEGEEFLAMEGPEFNKLVGGVVCTKCRTAICDCVRDAKRAEEQGVDMRVDTVANAQQFNKIQGKLLVLARSRPEDKYCLVTGLKERGNVVAVTGDGTNDAPALKKADVGFAMGNSGTQIAREAAAIILIDDNFNSIVKAVLWGRNIYDSIRKFIQFQLTVNVVAVVTTLIGGSVLQSAILSPIQMLWVNLIMDTLASLALATEDPEDALLQRKPHSRDQYIISRSMLKHIIGQAIFQIIVVLTLAFAGEQFIPEYVDSYDNSVFAAHPEYKWANGIVGGAMRSGRLYKLNGDSDYYNVLQTTGCYSRHYTFIFNTFVFMQIFNFINARKLHEEFNVFSGITKNNIFLFVVIGIITIQILLVTFAGYAFGLYSNYGLAIQQWIICIAIGSFSLVVSFLLKLLPASLTEHQEQTTSGNCDKPIQFRRKSILSLKRIQERVERDLAKNHPFD